MHVVKKNSLINRPVSAALPPTDPPLPAVNHHHDNHQGNSLPPLQLHNLDSESGDDDVEGEADKSLSSMESFLEDEYLSLATLSLQGPYNDKPNEAEILFHYSPVSSTSYYHTDVTIHEEDDNNATTSEEVLEEQCTQMIVRKRPYIKLHDSEEITIPEQLHCSETIVMRRSEPRFCRNNYTTTVIHSQPRHYKETVELSQHLVNVHRSRSYLRYPVDAQIQCYDYIRQWKPTCHRSELVIQTNHKPVHQFQWRQEKDLGLRHFRTEIHVTLNTALGGGNKSHAYAAIDPATRNTHLCSKSRDHAAIDPAVDISIGGLYDVNVAILTTAHLYFSGDHWSSVNGHNKSLSDCDDLFEVYTSSNC